ncbi:MAG: hypothetical protein CBC48_18930 [bacterium TMED88]|nr:hypothetical protein [Deltaproteobacteria bacterium]OUV23248.1 MAG: hypothetical protein CBC48_18930 [bacterium TMED88]
MGSRGSLFRAFFLFGRIGAAWLMVFALAWPVSADSDSIRSDHCEIIEPESCIRTPAGYKSAWDRYEVRCVDPSLFVTVPWGYDVSGGGNTGDTHLYPEEFALAWANGSTNLERYLELRCQYREDPIKTRVGIGSFVGFPVPIANRNPDAARDPISIFVYSLDAVRADRQELAAGATRLRVPSFETWFQLLEEVMDLRFDLNAQKEVVLRYSNIPVFESRPLWHQKDVVRVFTEITGCQKSLSWRRQPGFPPTSNLKGCNESYRLARAAAGGMKVGPGGPTTQECLENFKKHYDGPRDAAAFRGLLELCQDANALNTGVGLGYNPMPNPFVCKTWRNQTVAEKYTGREYVVPNGALRPEEQGETWEVVTLEPVADARYNLRAGYCRPER